MADVLSRRDSNNNLNTAGNLRKIKVWGKALDANAVADYCGCKLLAAAKACNGYVLVSGPYSRMKFSTVYANDAIGVGHGQGRLGSIQAWSASWPQPGEWMQIDLGEKQTIGGVVTQGRHWSWQIVTSFKVCVPSCHCCILS